MAIRTSYLLNSQRNDFDSVFAGVWVSRSAFYSLLVEDVSFITEEVNASADHANEEVLTFVFATGDTEEFLEAVNLL